MVDFQSRDTSRGYGDDEDDEDEEAESATDESAEGAGEREGDAAGTGESTARSGDDSGGDSPESSESSDPSDVTEDASGGGTTTDDVSDDETAVEDGAPTEPASDPVPGSSGPSEPGGSGSAEPSSDPLAPSGSGGGVESTSDAPTESDADPLADSTDRSSEPTGEAVGGPETAGRETVETDDDGRHHGGGRGQGDEQGHGEGRSHDGHSHGEEHSHGDGHSPSGGHDRGGAHSHAGGHDHEHTHAADIDLLGVAVVTVSSTRTHENDPSGDVIEAVIEAADHKVVTREILRDDLDGVQTSLLHLTGRDDVDVVVTTGGTGVTPDDVTVEAARPLFDRELPGFGELFRILSYEEIGTRALASRATAGMVDGVAVFCLPGSESAVRLATDELVVEEMGHLVGLARRDD